MLCYYQTKIGNVNLLMWSAARLQKRKQNHKFSVLPVMSENYHSFPISTQQPIVELHKLYHSAVVVASIFVHPQLNASI